MMSWQQKGTLTDREDLAYIQEQWGELYRVTESTVSGHASWRAEARNSGDVLTADTGDALLWAIRRHYWTERHGR